MEDLKIIKNAGDVTGVPDEEALSLISRFTRNTPDAEDIYTFTVTLCDNEIDRDHERFSLPALNTLSEMFVGVTGIFDHSMKSADQTARIYKTQVVEDPARQTSAGERYTALKAWCYMLRTGKNRDLIDEINAGIKKEVSVSCSMGSKICSVCGRDMRSPECRHMPGEEINGKVCHAVLDDPADAYEWSFVAVPAQRNAGVSKSMKKKSAGEKTAFIKEQVDPEEIIKSALGSKGSVSLTPAQVKTVSDYIESMRMDAENGKLGRLSAEKDIIALSAFTLPDADTAMLSEILKKLTSDEVLMLKKAFGDRAEKLSVYTPVFRTGTKENRGDDSQFKI